MRANSSHARPGFLVLSLSALAIAATPVSAQDIDELVVSVRKTEENAQEVPIQVTALTSQLIQTEAVRNLNDVARLTPSLQFDQGFWPSDTRITIRGLFQRAGRPSAAVLIDGIDAISEAFESTGGSALLNQRLLDLERVEVARGPQSALYGRAAFAGGINYVTRRPPEEFEITAQGGIGERGRRELFATVGGPLIEGVLSAKLLGSHYELDGDYTNPNTGGKLGGGESQGVGIAFNWTPTENFSAYWNTTYSDDQFAPQAIALVEANVFRVVKADGTLIPDAMPSPLFDLGSTGFNLGAGDQGLWAVSGRIRAGESDIDIAPDPRSAPGNPRDFPGTDDQTLRSSLILDFDISDNLALRSATSFTDATQRINFDSTQTARIPVPGVDGFGPPTFGGSGGNFADARNEFQIEQIYQEFQLTGTDEARGINWLVGLNAFFEDGSNLNNSRFWYRDPNYFLCSAPNFVSTLPAPCSFRDAPVFNKTVSRDTESYSLFGLFAWQFAERWKATVEARWIRDEIEISADTADLGADALAFDTPTPYDYAGSPGFTDSIGDTNFVPRVTLEFLPTDNVMVYASYSEGIKPPTYNTTDLADPEVARVRKEKLKTYELGAKSTLAEGKLLLNGALFYNDYQDQQIRAQLPPQAGALVPRSGVFNAGKVVVWGAEIDASWVPTDRLTLTASYAYTNGEFDDFNLREIQEGILGGPVQPGLQLSRSEIVRSGNLNADFTGNDTPGNPEHAASFLARYEYPLNDTFDAFGQTTIAYQGERFADKDNLVELEDYWLVNGQIGVQADNWFVSVYAENLFDDDTIRYAQTFIDQGQGFQLGTFTFPLGYFAYLPQPRTVGLRFSYKTN